MMRTYRALPAVSALALIAGAASLPTFAAGNSILPPISHAVFYPYGTAKVADAKVTGEPFQNAITLTQPSQPRNFWDSGAVEGITSPVTKGEKLVATFYARAVSPATGKFEFTFEEASGKYARSATKLVTLTKKWQKVTVPFSPIASYTTTQAHVAFHTGYAKQTIQIGGLTLSKSGK